MKDSQFEEEKRNVQRILRNALESYYEGHGLATIQEQEQCKDFLTLLTDDRIRLCINCFFPYIARNEDDVCCSEERCQEALKSGKFSELFGSANEEANDYRRRALAGKDPHGED